MQTTSDKTFTLPKIKNLVCKGKKRFYPSEIYSSDFMFKFAFDDYCDEFDPVTGQPLWWGDKDVVDNVILVTLSWWHFQD